MKVSEQIDALLGALFREGDIIGWQIGRGTRALEGSTPYNPRVWPVRIAQEFECQPPDEVHLCPSVIDRHGAFVSTRLTWALIPGLAGDMTVAAIQPTLVIEQDGARLLGWLLSEPCLDGARAARVNEQAARAVGGVVGNVREVVPCPGSPTPRTRTVTAGDPLRRVVAVPGSFRGSVRLNKPWPKIALQKLDSALTYSIEALERALAKAA